MDEVDEDIACYEILDETVYKDVISAITRRKRRVYNPGETIAGSSFRVLSPARLLSGYGGMALSLLVEVGCEHVKAGRLFLNVKPIWNTYQRARDLEGICPLCAPSSKKKKHEKGYKSEEEDRIMEGVKVANAALNKFITGPKVNGFFGCSEVRQC